MGEALRITDYLKDLDFNVKSKISTMETNISGKQEILTNSDEPFQIFWDKLLHDGVAEFIDDS